MRAFTATEVVAFTSTPEPTVRKDLQWLPHVGGEAQRPARIDRVGALYFYAAAQLHLGLGPEERKHLHTLIRNAIAHHQADVDMRPFLTLRVALLGQAFDDELTRFETWKQKLVENEEILGGETVFAGTRLAVRHIGGMVLRGVNPQEIREDDPRLGDEDLEFAKRYTIAYPRIGRPRVKDPV